MPEQPLSEQIASYLRRKGSPLARFSNDFVQVGNKYGIDPRFLVAVSGIETGFGKAGSGLANPFGYMSAKRFSGPREVLERMGRDLTRTGQGAYYDGKDTIDAIGATWAPPRAANDAGGNAGWPAAVRRFYQELGGNPNAAVKGRRRGAVGGVTDPGANPVGALTGQMPGAYGSAANSLQRLGAPLSADTISAIKAYSDRSRAAVSNRTFVRNDGQFEMIKNALLANLRQGQTAATETVRQVGTGAVPTDQSVGLGATRGASAAIRGAQRWIGTPYSWGGGTPSGPTRGFAQGANTVGFDCSSLVQHAWAKAGVNLPRTTYQQIKVGLPVAGLKNAQPGDLLFPSTGHVQMYLGNGQVIEAPQTGGRVQIVKARPSYIAIRRPR